MRSIIQPGQILTTIVIMLTSFSVPVLYPQELEFELLAEFKTQWVADLEWSSDSTQLATADSRSVIIWDALTGEQITVLEEPDRYSFVDIAWHPVEPLLASIYNVDSNSGGINIWNTAGRTLVHFIEVPGQLVRSVQWSFDGNNLITLQDETIVFWDVATWTSISTWRIDAYRVFRIAASPDGSRLAVGEFNDNAIVTVYDIYTRERLITLRDQYGIFSLVDTLSWSPTGEHLAGRLTAGGNHGFLTVWNATNGDIEHTLDFYVVAWSPNGRYMATTTHDWEPIENVGDVTLLDLPSGTRLSFKGSPEMISRANA